MAHTCWHLARAALVATLIWSSAPDGEAYAESPFGPRPSTESLLELWQTAESLFGLWPTCEDPTALAAANFALTAKDAEELARLGCAAVLPDSVWLRTLRCGSYAPKSYQFGLDVDIVWKPKLPKAVCEIQAWYPDHWVKLFYTSHRNIYATHELILDDH